ncbi:MAG: hypothetical protein ACW986_11160 [Promethearchaeota archaeon]|jgi:hypothetical protein
MLIKKKISFLVGSIVYITMILVFFPIIIVLFDLYKSIYDIFADMASVGFFFLLFLVSTIFFFPFIYSTIVKGGLSLNIRAEKKGKKNPRFLGLTMFVIGIPLIILTIFGIAGYYSIGEFRGGLGELVYNGFLITFIVLLYFCIFPAFILSTRKVND